MSAMERVAVQTAVESMRHPPALYWGVVSAAALCSLYGTFALAKRSSSNNSDRTPIRNGRVSPSVAVKKLRRGLHRQYRENVRPLLENLVYLAMFLLNIWVGVFYWIMDFFFEGWQSASQKFVESNVLGSSVGPDGVASVCSRPRRGEIKRPRTRWAWTRSNSKPNLRKRCECWGWNVKELALGDGLASPSSEELQLGLQRSHSCNLKRENVTTIAGIGDTSTKIPQDEDQVTIRPRWTECHCDQCAALLMPMHKASEKLHVFSRDTEEPLNNTPKAADEFSSNDVSQKKDSRTAVIFIHGMFSSATFWFDTDIASHLSESLTHQHQVLAPDLLGCGRSPRPVDSLYTLADQVEAIEKSVIGRYKLESFHLVGHSMGSIVALALAARCPQRVRSVTLIAPVYPPSCLGEDGELAQIPCDAFFSFLDPLTLKGVRALTVCKYYNVSRLIGHLLYAKHLFWVDFVHNLLKRKGYPRSFIHDYLTNYHDAAWHIAHNSLLAGTHAVIPALKKLRDSGHPVLVIHGEIDTSIQFRLAEEMSRTFSNVQLVAVPEKGHVDVVLGRAKENALLIEKAVSEGDERWHNSNLTT